MSTTRQSKPSGDVGAPEHPALDEPKLKPGGSVQADRAWAQHRIAGFFAGQRIARKAVDGAASAEKAQGAEGEAHDAEAQPQAAEAQLDESAGGEVPAEGGPKIYRAEIKGRSGHADDRRRQGQTDPHRQVGDANRVARRGRKFEDTETGNIVYVDGDRVVITTKAGKQVTQFKNSRANTQARIQQGKWKPIA
jgi:hypothetical protein